MQTVLEQQPLSGHVFCFRGRRGDVVKLLWHDGDGLCLFQKRLERGRFVWPQATEGKVSLTRAQLSMLLEGTEERLWSNLLSVEGLPAVVYVAATQLRYTADIWDILNRKQIRPASGWILWEKKIVSFEDFSGQEWDTICEPGTVEGFDTSAWSESDDPERTRLFVQLLNRTLRAQMDSRIRFWPKDDCFAMVGEKRKQSYKSLKRTSGLTVVSQFMSKIKDGREFPYRRHLVHPLECPFDTSMEVSSHTVTLRYGDADYDDEFD